MQNITRKHKAYHHFLYANDVKNLEQTFNKISGRIPQLLSLVRSETSGTGDDEPEFDLAEPEFRPVHYPMTIVNKFGEIAEPNTKNRIETCGILCGIEKDGQLYVKNILIPDQKGTSDSCTTSNYESILSYVMGQDMIVLGWIHTHPEYDCFLSSIDLHTHYGYQKLLPEAIAIVISGLNVSASEK